MEVSLLIEGDNAKKLPLLSPDAGGEVEARIAQFLPTWMLLTPNGALFNRRVTSKCCEPLQPLHVHSGNQPEPSLGVNQLYVPTGLHRWSKMYSLMRWKDLSLIYRDYAKDDPRTANPNPTQFVDLEWKDVDKKTKKFKINRIYDCFISRAVKISSGVLRPDLVINHKENDVFLVEIVDWRYALQHRVMTYVPSSSWRWDAISTQLQAATDYRHSLGTFLDIGRFPGMPDRNYLHRPGESLAVIGEAALNSFAQTFMPSVQTRYSDDSAEPRFTSWFADRDLQTAKIAIHFIRKNNGKIDCDSEPFIIEIDSGHIDNTDTVLAESRLVVHSSAIAEFNGGNATPVNYNELLELCDYFSQNLEGNTVAPDLTSPTTYGVTGSLPDTDSVLIDFPADSGGVIIPSRQKPVSRFFTSYAVDKQTKKDCSNIRLVKAPSGGIPGRVGTLLGTADCSVWVENSTTKQIEDSGTEINVANWATSAVCKNGDRYGIAGWLNERWYIISEDCNDGGSTIQPASTSSTVTTPTNPLQIGSPPVLGIGGQFYPADWKTAGTGGGIE